MQKNILKIILKDDGWVGLKLLNGDSVLAEIDWGDGGQTSQKLLKQIDSFLAENNLKVTELAEVQADISENQKFTLARIVKITAKTLNYCLEAQLDIRGEKFSNFNKQTQKDILEAEADDRAGRLKTYSPKEAIEFVESIINE